MVSDYISSRGMRALEINAEYYGISLLQLMENAGRNVALEINSRYPRNKNVAVCCGLGGNGGDGFVVARHLLCLGYTVKVILYGRSKNISHPSALANWNNLQNLSSEIELYEVSDSSEIPEVESDIIVDALLGTGTTGKLRSPIFQAVQKINDLKGEKISIDVPTGLDSDTGEVLGVAVRANLTVTFYKAKKGLENSKDYVGELVVRDIGLPPLIESFVGPGDVSLVVRKRKPTSHKGDFGKLLVIGGSEVYSGAPVLASMAALRTGVDVVFTAAPEKAAHDMASMSPNLITIKLKGSNLNVENLSTIEKYMLSSNAVLIGPGLGSSEETAHFVDGVLDIVENLNKPLVLDADGINAYAKSNRKISSPLILTPHRGEFATLTKSPPPENLQAYYSEVKDTARELNAVLLVKGNIDVISDGERIKFNFSGNPGMSVGGTGDVLSGIVGGLLSQGNDPFEAAVAGAFVNGAAGDFAKTKYGYHITASDLWDFIPEIFDGPMNHTKVRSNFASGN